jgi:hypothetical protein
VPIVPAAWFRWRVRVAAGVVGGHATEEVADWAEQADDIVKHSDQWRSRRWERAGGAAGQEDEEDEDHGDEEEEDEDHGDEEEEDEDHGDEEEEEDLDAETAKDEVLERIMVALAPLGLVAEVGEEEGAGLLAGDEGGTADGRSPGVGPWGDPSGGPCVALPVGGVCVGSAVLGACRVVRSVPRLGLARAILIFRPAPDPDADVSPLPSEVEWARRQWAAEGFERSGENSMDGWLSTHVPRPLQCVQRRLGVVLAMGPESHVRAEALHAQLASHMARVWRESGLDLGDAVPPYSHTAVRIVSREASLIDAQLGDVAATALETGTLAPLRPGGRVCGPSRLVAVGLVPPGSLSVAEIAGVAEDDVFGVSPPTGVFRRRTPIPGSDASDADTEKMSDVATPAGDDADAMVAQALNLDLPAGRVGFGLGRLQRFFVQNLFRRLAAARIGSKSAGGDGSEEDGGENDDEEEEEEEDTVGGEDGGAYAEIVSNFGHCLAGMVVASYVLALGPRRPGDVLISPSGTAVLGNLGFAAGEPEPSLHVDSSAAGADVVDPSDPPRFSSRAMVHDLLAVLGQHSGATGPGADMLPLSPQTARLLAVATDAFLALRRRADELVAIAGSMLPTAPAGMQSVHDIACLRSRLLLHLSDRDAAAAFTTTIIQMLHLDVDVEPQD